MEDKNKMIYENYSIDKEHMDTILFERLVLTTWAHELFAEMSKREVIINKCDEYKILKKEGEF